MCIRLGLYDITSCSFTPTQTSRPALLTSQSVDALLSSVFYAQRPGKRGFRKLSAFVFPSWCHEDVVSCKGQIERCRFQSCPPLLPFAIADHELLLHPLTSLLQAGSVSHSVGQSVCASFSSRSQRSHPPVALLAYLQTSQFAPFLVHLAQPGVDSVESQRL